MRERVRKRESERKKKKERERVCGRERERERERVRKIDREQREIEREKRHIETNTKTDRQTVRQVEGDRGFSSEMMKDLPDVEFILPHLYQQKPCSSVYLIAPCTDRSNGARCILLISTLDA